MTNAEATTDTAANVAALGADIAPTKPASKKGATRKKVATKGQKGAKKAKPAAKPNAAKKGAKPAKARAESKSAKILELIGRAKGASLAEIMAATKWQAHSVRGFLSTASKKQRINIESAKNDAGERVYKVAK